MREELRGGAPIRCPLPSLQEPHLSFESRFPLLSFGLNCCLLPPPPRPLPCFSLIFDSHQFIQGKSDLPPSVGGVLGAFLPIFSFQPLQPGFLSFNCVCFPQNQNLGTEPEWDFPSNLLFINF